MNNHTAIVPLQQDERKTKKLLKKKHNSRRVLRLLDYLHTQDQFFERSPGFSHALFLNYDRLLPEHFSIQGSKRHKRLIYHHVPPPGLCLDHGGESVSLGTYLAVLDEVTTWALMAHGKKRPGISLNLHAEWGNAIGTSTPKIQAGVPCDIIATVENTGRNLGFVKAKVVQQNQTVVAFGGHVKYLKMGLWSSLWNRGARPFQRLFSKFAGSEPAPQTYSLGELFENLKFQSFHQATFVASPAHAGYGRDLHGGCQAILMELVGEQTAKDALAAYTVELESISITNMSPSTPSVVIRAKVLNCNEFYVKTRVVLLARTMSEPHGGRVISEGLLHWRASSSEMRRRHQPRPLQPQTSTSCFSVTTNDGSCEVEMGGQCHEDEDQRWRAAVYVPHFEEHDSFPQRIDQRRQNLSMAPIPSHDIGMSFSSDSDTTLRTGTLASKATVEEEGESVELKRGLSKRFSSRNARLLPPSLRYDDDTSVWSPVSSQRYLYSVKASSDLVSGHETTTTSRSKPRVQPEFDPYETTTSQSQSHIQPEFDPYETTSQSQPHIFQPEFVPYETTSQSQPPIDPFETTTSHQSIQTEFDPFEINQGDASTVSDSLVSVPSPSLVGSTDAELVPEEDWRQRSSPPALKRRASSPGLDNLLSLASPSESVDRDDIFRQSNPPPPPPPPPGEAVREYTRGPESSSSSFSFNAWRHNKNNDDGDDESLFDRFHIPYLGFAKDKKKVAPKTSSPGLKSTGLGSRYNNDTPGRKQLRIEDFDVSAIPTAHVTVLPIAVEESDGGSFNFF